MENRLNLNKLYAFTIKVDHLNIKVDFNYELCLNKSVLFRLKICIKVRSV